MNYRMIGYLLSVILIIEASLLSIPTLTAIINDEPWLPFVLTMLILVAISLPSVIFKPKNKRFHAKEGYVCVATSWILMSVFGALPFVFSGAIPNYIDALFETVSGFTTTGATILTEIQSLDRGILLWRSLTQWLGGMGVLMFMLAILPTDGSHAIHLLRAEVPGPTKGKLVPKVRRTAIILYGIYFVLTVIMIVALCIAGLPFYDAVVNSLSTAGTGGFSVLNNSIAGYQNPAAEWIIAIFMFLFGINFNIYFFLFIRNFRDIWKNEELRLFFGITLFSTVTIAINTWRSFENAADCIRASFFQVTSIMSTTGFVIEDFGKWPAYSQAVIILLMLMGACAGSTAGGFKIARLLIVFKNTLREIKHMLRPRSVNRVRIDGKPLSEETVRSANRYLAIYLIISAFSFLLVSLNGFTTETSLSAVISCINNVGPLLGTVGPFGSFANFSIFSKIVLTLDMLLGRLEIVPIIILFSPTTWIER